MRARSTWIFAAVGIAGALGVGAFACSLGLDPSLIPGSDASIVEGGKDAGVDAPNPVQCKADPDCKSTNGCLTGKCDTTRNQCVYTLCPANACSASVCGTGNQCSAPSTYGFHAGTFHVSLGNIGCGGGGPGARRCFAAVYPFVFVGTTNGVVAYPVEDPTNTAPTSIPVAGLPFFPSFIVSSGTTVYFVGAVAGTGPDYKIPIATLDVPTDPTISEMSASTVFDTLQVTSVEIVVPDATGGIYLVHADAPNSYPSARIAAPLKDLDSLSFQQNAGFPANSAVAAASGTRLVTFRQDNGYPADSYFSIETGAATSGAQNLGEQDTIPTMGQSQAPDYLAQSPTGGILWSAAAVTIPDGGAGQTVSARLAWVLDDDNATKFDATTHVDVSTYNIVGLGADLPGPVAWLDDNTAIVISAPPANTAQALVQIASRNGTPAVVANRSFQLAFHPSQLAVAGSNGFGYVLTPDQTAGANVHVFGTTCDN
jgi:hypothetical protein